MPEKYATGYDPARAPLRPKEQTFVQVLYETGDKIKAAQAACLSGLVNGQLTSTGRSAICRMLQRPRVVAALDRLRHSQEAADRFTLDWLRAEHIRLAKEAEKAGDLTNCTRNLEAVGRTMGAYSDTLSIDTGRVKAYTELERLEARRLSRLLLESKVVAEQSGGAEPSASPDQAVPGQGQRQDGAGAAQDGPGSTITDQGQAQDRDRPRTHPDAIGSDCGQMRERANPPDGPGSDLQTSPQILCDPKSDSLDGQQAIQNDVV